MRCGMGNNPLRLDRSCNRPLDAQEWHLRKEVIVQGYTGLRVKHPDDLALAFPKADQKYGRYALPYRNDGTVLWFKEGRIFKVDGRLHVRTRAFCGLQGDADLRIRDDEPLRRQSAHKYGSKRVLDADGKNTRHNVLSSPKLGSLVTGLGCQLWRDHAEMTS